MIRSILTMVALVASNPLMATPIALSPGVIVSPEREAAFIADPRGMTQRVSLETGLPDWVSAEPVYPLALADGWLIGLGAPDGPGSAKLILMNPENGGVEDRVSIDLPESVTANVFPQPGRRFLASLLDTAEGARVFWRYEYAELRGAAVVEADGNGEESINPVSVQSGAFDLIQAAGRYYAVPVRASYSEPEAPLVVLADSERVRGVDGRQFRAANDTHVMTSDAQPDARFGQLYQWAVYQRDGERVGGFQSPYSRLPFAVSGGQMLVRDLPVEYADQRGRWVSRGTRLTAIKLSDGSELWSVDVLDHEYRGTLPP